MAFDRDDDMLCDDTIYYLYPLPPAPPAGENPVSALSGSAAVEESKNEIKILKHFKATQRIIKTTQKQK